jgi:hypothetical protein
LEPSELRPLKTQQSTAPFPETAERLYLTTTSVLELAVLPSM